MFIASGMLSGFSMACGAFVTLDACYSARFATAARLWCGGSALLSCSRGHSFDVARSGYVNLLQPQDKRSKHPGDSAEAIAARRRLHDSGVTRKLLDGVGEILSPSPDDVVLDAGCGDGFYLGNLAKERGFQAHGVDISIPAVDSAARRYPGNEWIVANADRFIPYSDAAFSMVLSITARMNADEFRRGVLRDAGRLLVAVPAPDDLIELRGVGRDRVERTVETFASHFSLVDKRRVSTPADLDAAAVEDILLSIYRPMRAERPSAMRVTFSLDLLLFQNMRARLCIVGKLTTRAALLAGFGGLLILMAFAGVDAVSILNQIQTRNERIRNDFVHRNRTLEQIRSDLYLSGTFIRDYLFEPDARAAETHRASLEQTHRQMGAYIESYEKLLPAQESAAFDVLRQELRDYWRILDPALGWSPEQRRQFGYPFWRNEVYPRRTTMLGIADQIAAFNEQQLLTGNQQINDLFAQFRLRLGITLAVTLGLGFTLAAFVMFRILRLENDAALRYAEIAKAREELKELSARLVEGAGERTPGHFARAAR